MPLSRFIRPASPACDGSMVRRESASSRSNPRFVVQKRAADAMVWEVFFWAENLILSG